MNAKDISLMHKVANMRFQAEQDLFRSICAEEEYIRSLIDGLNQHEKRARGALENDHAMRTFGNDIAWMNWADQHRRRLTARLANVLARKEAAFAQYREAYGRDAVLAQLVDRERKLAAAKSISDEFTRLEEELAFK